MRASARHTEGRQPWGRPDSAHWKSSVLGRSTILALIIGSALTSINQSAAVFGSDTLEILPLLLAYATPFAVVAISQLLAIRRAWQDATPKPLPETRESFIATALSHGIPARALTLGLSVGAVNSAIILSEAFSSPAGIAGASTTLLAQVYSLPILFGFLSQAVAYRRERVALRTSTYRHLKGEHYVE